MNDTTDLAKELRILIVEDQEAPLEVLKLAVRKVVPQYVSEFSTEDYDVAKCYVDAENMICETEYDMVLLDHRMPYSNPGFTDADDFDAFVRLLDNIGYDLIKTINEKNPETIVIGTSSSSNIESRLKPDFTIRKMYGESDEDLTEIFDELRLKKTCLGRYD